jgi:hypothetical protein
MLSYLKMAGRLVLAVLLTFAISHVTDVLPHVHGLEGVSLGMAFGAPFRAKSRQQIQNAVTPASGKAQESIWHCLYDTQAFVSATTIRQTFFQTLNVDSTLSNMEAGGQLASPQSFEVHNICVDLLPVAGVSTSASNVGNADDMARILFAIRPVWTLTISQKSYGPYPLTALHGTGGVQAFFGTAIATPGSLQYGRNDPSPGWNYYGRIIIPEQVGFKIDVVYAATAVVTASINVRVAMFGVLNRRIV